MQPGLAHAAIAGLLGALAGVLGKVSTSSENWAADFLPEALFLPFRIVTFGLVFLVNALMLRFFMKGMALSNSRDASAINMGANFLFTVRS